MSAMGSRAPAGVALHGHRGVPLDKRQGGERLVGVGVIVLDHGGERQHLVGEGMGLLVGQC